MTARLLLAATIGLALAAPAFAKPAPSKSSASGGWGFDLAGRDLAVRPGDDFYDYAVGDYLKTLRIPPDRSRWGSFSEVDERTQNQVHAILEQAAAHPNARGDERLVGDFYKAFMDEARVDALGAKPLEPELAQIRAADTRAKLAALMGRSNPTYFSSIFNVGISADSESPLRYAIDIGQGGLGLPDRDYYLTPEFAAQKAAYQVYIAHLLSMVRWPNARAEAADIVGFETKIAEASWTRAERRDPIKTYNPMTPAELAAVAGGFDWSAFLAAADLNAAPRVIVAEPSALPKIAAIFAETPIATLQAWGAFHFLDNAAPFLSAAFDQAHFEFHEKTLSGQPQERPRWKRAEATLNDEIGKAVGKLYVERYFPPSSKATMLTMIANLRAALAARIQNLTWMSSQTKAKALQKLSMLRVKVGYPDKWRDYRALRISPGDLFGDVERADRFEWNREVRRLYGPVDRQEWFMNPQTVNAYYNPRGNEIVFPAAILQKPFFDVRADAAINYGAIGAVIGHEMTHGFDDQGRRFDGTGKLTNWWTPADAARFEAEAKRLGAQYSAFEPIAGAHINGDLTMGENIADLGGNLLAHDAYRLYLHGRRAPVLSGYTGDQRVFLGWAQVWRGKIRPDAVRRQLVSDPHSPNKERVNGVFRNIDAWYVDFHVGPGDKLYTPPDQRVRIW